MRGVQLTLPVKEDIPLVVISRPFSHRRGGGSTLLVIPGDVRRRYGSLYLDIYVNNILF